MNDLHDALDDSKEAWFVLTRSPSIKDFEKDIIRFLGESELSAPPEMSLGEIVKELGLKFQFTRTDRATGKPEIRITWTNEALDKRTVIIAGGAVGGEFMTEATADERAAARHY